MSQTERLTAPAANAASVLEHEMRRLFSRDGVLDLDERRALKLSHALTRETNDLDAQVGVIVSGLHVRGLRSPQFARRLREYRRDFDPTPDGPATKKAA